MGKGGRWEGGSRMRGHMHAAAAKSLQSCLTLSDPMDCSLPGFSIHGIFQARVLEWGAIAFSRTCVYLWLIHVNVWQKPEQYCKAIILQLKLNKLKKIRYINVSVCVCVCVCVCLCICMPTQR